MLRKHVSLFIVLSLIVPILFVLPMGNANANAPFTTNALVNSSYTNGDQVTPSICVESNTTVHAVYEDVQGQSSRVFYTKSTNGGLTFVGRVMLNGASVPGSVFVAETPVIAMDSTHVLFVVWSDNSSGTFRIYLSKSVDDGGHFSDPVLVTASAVGNQTHPDIAIAGSFIYVTWAEFNQVDTDIYFARSTDGVSFSTALRINSQIRDIQYAPTIAASGMDVFIAWHDSRDDGFFDIYGAVSHNNGNTFGSSPSRPTNVKISNAGNGTEQTRPDAVILPDGRIVVVWQDGRNGNLDIYSSISTDHGTSFGTNFKVSDDPGNGVQSDPSICADPRGAVTIAYRDNRLGDYHVYSARSNNATTYWPSVMVNDNSLAAQKSPSVAASPNGTAFVAFSDNRTGNQNVYLSARYNLAPTCVFSSPVEGATLPPGRQEIVGQAADPELFPNVTVQVKWVSPANAVETAWTNAYYDGHLFWNYTIPTQDYTNGDYRILARSYDGAVYSPVVQLNVTFDNGAQPWIDLTITSSRISFEPASPVAGENVFISADVWNIGTSVANNVEVRFLKGATTIGYIILDRVLAGGSAMAEINWTAEQGTYQMGVSVDPLNTITERNETNNTATKQIVVAAAPILEPDLQITSKNITWAPDLVHAGDLVDISAFIYNEGEEVGAMPVKFQIDGLDIGNANTGLVPPQDGRIVHQSWTAVLGNHTLTVNIDPMHSSNDSNFTNNMASVHILVVAVNVLKPDIAITNSSIIVSPQSPVLGDNVTLSVLVSNVGDRSASNVLVTFYLDGQPLANRTIPLLLDGVNQDVSVNYTAKLGNHSLMVKVDELNAIDELDETNNTAYATFVVHNANELKPDLAVSSQSIVLVPSTPVKGEVLRFNVTVTNTGNDSASNVLVLMKVDGVDIGSPTIGYIGPGESRLVTGQWLATGGAHTFTVTLDPDNLINESSKANNQASVSFSLSADPINIPWEYIGLVLALGVLAFGAYSFVRSRKGKTPKQPKEPEQPE